MSVIFPFLFDPIRRAIFPGGSGGEASSKPPIIEKIIGGFLPTELVKTNDLEFINPKFLTHIYCGTLRADPFGGLLFEDVKNVLKLNIPETIRRMKYKNEKLKILLSCILDSKSFRIIKSSKLYFIREVCRTITKYGYNGINFKLETDLDEEKHNLINFFKDMKRYLKRENYLLTASTPCLPEFFGTKNIENFVGCLDILNIVSCENPPLYEGECAEFINPLMITNPCDSFLRTSSRSVDTYVNEWIEAGAPNEKICFGIPFNAWLFKLKEYRYNTVVMGTFLSSCRTSGMSYVNYNKITLDDLVKTLWNAEKNSSYSYNTRYWISYEERKSVAAKVRFMHDNNLGGVVGCHLLQDDLRGEVENHYGQHLLSLIYLAINGLRRSDIKE